MTYFLSPDHPTMQTTVRFNLLLLLLLSAGSVQAAGPKEAKEAQPESGVRIERDVAYLGEGRTEKLDLYLPAKFEEGKRYPAVVIIHGGGWTGGDKGAAREINIGTTLAGVGYVCASINYELAKKAEENFAIHLASVWPRNLHDCKTAVRWLRKNADKYQIDTKHIGVIGGSAGGHLTAMLGVTGTDAGLDPAEPFGDFSCQVQAIVPMYGAGDLTDLAQARKLFEQMTDEQRALCVTASPVSHASQDDPPALILHGTADALVPVRQSELLHAALKKAGVKSELVIIEGAPHTFHLQPKERDLRPLVIGFFDEHLKK